MPAERRRAPPADRDALLVAAGEGAREIYFAVHSALDELEAAAPWDQLYYPPEDTADFVALGGRLADTVAAIPPRMEHLGDSLEAAGAGEETVADVRFFFDGIHAMAAPELAKLRSRLQQVESGELDLEERAEICEIAADLKGKYTSSLMGAAASLIAQDRWDGVAIEPILFPEKAEEFARNRVLLATLEEVLAAIAQLHEELPLPRLVEVWRRGKRVDQYALTPFYAFLGTLGKLLKENTRRALYSGDHHQIRKREGALAARINELNALHNVSWGTMPAFPGSDPATLYETMVARAVEIAAVLDVDMLKRAIGEGTVRQLHAAVQLEGERAKTGIPADEAFRARTRQHLPPELHSLVALLHDEDLKTFLDLLVGSVRKRASLAYEAGAARAAAQDVAPELAELVDGLDDGLDVGREGRAPELDPETGFHAFDDEGFGEDSAVVPPPEDPGEDAGERRLLPDIDDFLDDAGGWQPELEEGTAMPVDDERWRPAAQPPTEVSDETRAATIETLHRTLATLLGRGNQERKAFDFLHRFVKQKRSIPPGMVQSVHPFLRSLLQTVLPGLHTLAASGDLPASAGENLERSCRVLLDGRVTPSEMKREVPVNMDRILHLLEGLQSTLAGLSEEIAPGSSYWQTARAEDFSREF